MQIKIGYFLGNQHLFLNYFYRQVLWVLACIHAGFNKALPAWRRAFLLLKGHGVVKINTALRLILWSLRLLIIIFWSVILILGSTIAGAI